MAKNTLLVNVDIGETRVGLIADGVLRELYVERRHHRSPVGNIYLGRVTRVLPGMQAAFVEHDGFQCGYCTSGQIVSAVGLIDEGRAGSDAEVREFMSGNLCRCGAYTNIVAAIRSVVAEGAP